MRGRTTRQMPLLGRGSGGRAGRPADGLPAPTPASATIAPAPGASQTDADTHHYYSPRLWRLRHMKRSVLRDTQGSSRSTRSRTTSTGFRSASAAPTVEATARRTTSFFGGDASLSGQVQFLTATAFDDCGKARPPRGRRGRAGVAYATVGAPIGNTGQWSVQGAFGRGELSSWDCRRQLRAPDRTHALDLGASFALQGFSGDSPAGLMSVDERRRRRHHPRLRHAARTSARRHVRHPLRLPRLPRLPDTDEPQRVNVRVAGRKDLGARGRDPADAGTGRRGVRCAQSVCVSMPPQRTFTSASAGGRLSAERTTCRSGSRTPGRAVPRRRTSLRTGRRQSAGGNVRRRSAYLARTSGTTQWPMAATSTPAAGSSVRPRTPARASAARLNTRSPRRSGSGLAIADRG